MARGADKKKYILRYQCQFEERMAGATAGAGAGAGAKIRKNAQPVLRNTGRGKVLLWLLGGGD